MDWDAAAVVVTVLFSAATGFGLGRFVTPRPLIWAACGVGVLVGGLLTLIGDDLGSLSLLVGSPIIALVAVFSPSRPLPTV